MDTLGHYTGVSAIALFCTVPMFLYPLACGLWWLWDKLRGKS